MIERFSELKNDLTELATVLNQFKSEAVQLRLLELLFDAKVQDDVKGSEDAPKTSRRAKRRGKKAETDATTDTPIAGANATKEKSKKAASGSGAVGTLNGLVAGDFFKTYKTIGDVVEHSKITLARNFKANAFSGTLARLVRNRELTRRKNKDGQYEYQKP